MEAHKRGVFLNRSKITVHPNYRFYDLLLQKLLWPFLIPQSSKVTIGPLNFSLLNSLCFNEICSDYIQIQGIHQISFSSCIHLSYSLLFHLFAFLQIETKKITTQNLLHAVLKPQFCLLSVSKPNFAMCVSCCFNKYRTTTQSANVTCLPGQTECIMLRFCATVCH